MTTTSRHCAIRCGTPRHEGQTRHPWKWANQDIDDAVSYYLKEESEQAALGFIDTLERAYKHISRHPESGSSRYAHELDLPGLRPWTLKRYRYLVFYIERDDHIDVWRVLHGMSDIPVWMQGNDRE